MEAQKSREIVRTSRNQHGGLVGWNDGRVTPSCGYRVNGRVVDFDGQCLVVVVGRVLIVIVVAHNVLVESTRSQGTRPTVAHGIDGKVSSST